MDHSEHPRLLPDEMTDAVLTGATVYGPGDSTVGTVSHVHGSGSSARDTVPTVHAVSRWTKDDLKALPEHRD